MKWRHTQHGHPPPQARRPRRNAPPQPRPRQRHSPRRTKQQVKGRQPAGNVPAHNAVECCIAGGAASHQIDVLRYSTADELRAAVTALFDDVKAEEDSSFDLVSIDSGGEAMLVNEGTPWAWLQRECRA